MGQTTYEAVQDFFHQQDDKNFTIHAVRNPKWTYERTFAQMDARVSAQVDAQVSQY